MTGASSSHATRKPFDARSWGRYLPVMATGLLLLVAIGIGGLLYDNFVTGQVLANILISNSHLIVLAVGMTFVIFTGGIDLSVGAVVALSAMIAAKLMVSGWPAAAAIPVVLLTGSRARAARRADDPLLPDPAVHRHVGGDVPRPRPVLRDLDRVDPDQRRVLRAHVAHAGHRAAEHHRHPRRCSIALSTVVIAFFVLHYTRFGRTVYAIGGSEQSAVLMGLTVPRTKIAVYVISGFCASLGGMLFTFDSVQSGNPLHAIGMELDAIAAVAIGGTLAHRWVRLRPRIAPRGPRHRHDLVDHPLQRQPQLGLDADLQRFARARVHRDAARDHARARPPCVDDTAIAACHPGMHDVARLAQVSHQTVSRVLNDHPHVRPATKERVQLAIAELGYRRNAAARSLVTRRSGVIGLLTPRTELYGPTSSMVAVEVAAREAGFFVSLASVADTSAAALGCGRRALQGPGGRGGGADRPGVRVVHRGAHRGDRHPRRHDVRRLGRDPAVARGGGDGQPGRRPNGDRAPRRARSPHVAFVAGPSTSSGGEGTVELVARAA